MKITFLTFLLSLSFFVQAQFSNRIWCFGDSAGIDFSIVASPTTFTSAVKGRGSCCSIADSTNQLLMYGHMGNWITPPFICQLFNKNHKLMSNGDSLIGEYLYNEMLIIPAPGDYQKFYTIHMKDAFNPGQGLFYSTVDISQDSGRGMVIQKNVHLDTSMLFDGVEAIKHGNGRDWWIVYRRCEIQAGGNPNNKFYFYLVDDLGFHDYGFQSIGSNNTSAMGEIRFSHQGNKIAFVNAENLIEIFDFDRCTGQMSNPETINPALSGPYNYLASLEFSENDSILYVSSADQPSVLIQYNLSAANISASRQLIATLNNNASGGYLRMGPDKKIYWSCSSLLFYPWYPDTSYNNYNMNLSVINKPDSIGSLCDFQPFSFYLGGNRTYYGLPNNPDYNMYALGGSICDTLGLPNTVDHVPSEVDKNLNVFYHPDWQTAFINANGLRGKNYSLHIVDLSGKEIFSENGSLNSTFYTKNFHCENLSTGIYLVLLETEGERLIKKVILE